MPPLPRPADFNPATYNNQSQTPQPTSQPAPTPTTTATAADPDRSASASTSTLPPLDAEFLAELDFGSGMGAGGGAGMFWGDGIDWDALMSDGELWNNIGGGWNDGGDMMGGGV
jgi:hypothetical protein